MDDGRCVDQPWGALASDVVDAPSCIADCRQQFLTTLLSASALQDGGLAPVCQHLSTMAASLEEAFWSLYCCDAQRCGVDNLNGHGQDPNVNWLITSCQNIGFENVMDTGPPQVNRPCGAAGSTGQDLQCLTTSTPLATMSPLVVSSTTPTPSVTQAASATLTQSAIRDPSLRANLDFDSSSADSQSSSAQGLSTGVKVTIGLSATAALLLLAVGLFLLLRRRQDSRRRRLCCLDNASFSTMGSPAPLISPPSCFSPFGPDGVPLTPPPPLRERRMLDTRSHARDSSRSPSGFSRPPMLNPTLSKLIPRSEMIPRGLCPPRPTHCMVGAAAGGGVFGPPRGRSSASGRVPLPSTPRHGNVGVAVGIVRHNPADGVVLDQDAQDLCELTDEYARESRDTSWGSWRGGGGPGRVASGEHVGGSVMKEGDLERLAGRY